MKNILDVRNYNNPVLSIIALPFFLVAIVIMSVGLIFAGLSILIGRKPLFDAWFRFKEKLEI